MMCDICKKRTAMIFLEQNTPGEKKKLNLCVQCAFDRGISPNSKSIESTISSLFESLSAVSKENESAKDNLCPVCGTSLEKIKISRTVGCSECYSVFKDEITKLLEKQNITGEYTGKFPRHVGSVKSVVTDRIMLQNKLRAALETEDYEKAAVYRDYLKALEKKSVGSGEQNSIQEGNE